MKLIGLAYLVLMKRFELVAYSLAVGEQRAWTPRVYLSIPGFFVGLL